MDSNAEDKLRRYFTKEGMSEMELQSLEDKSSIAYPVRKAIGEIQWENFKWPIYLVILYANRKVASLLKRLETYINYQHELHILEQELVHRERILRMKEEKLSEKLEVLGLAYEELQHLARTRRRKDELLNEYNFKLRHNMLIHEETVVYYFSKYHEQLGFEKVVNIQPKFPDCIALRNGVEEIIEFEYKSTNFIKHGHDPNLCDIVVCWEKDGEVPGLEIIELSSELIPYLK